MNSEIEVNEGKFKLSILGALGMVISYYFIARGIISFPFYILSNCVGSHKTLKLIGDVLEYSIPAVIMIILLLKKIREDYKPDFKISYIEKFNFNMVICTIFLIIGLYLCLQGSILPSLENLPISETFKEGLKEFEENIYLRVSLAIIAAPIIEEILMRGIILEGLLNKYKPVTAIIVSAVIFGAIHMNIPQFISATIGGILLGYIYYKTKSLVLSIACHMINNTIVYFEINSSMITFFIGIAIFVTAIVFFEIFLKKMNHGDVNLKKNIA